MLVEVEVTIHGSKAAIWAAISDIANAAQTIRGIEKIEVLERPPGGLVGLRWRETRMLFGKPATAEKWITDEGSGGMTLASAHDSQPQSLVAKLLSTPMMFLFKGVAKKAILQDLNDIKSAVERG